MLEAPPLFGAADYVVMEATYGGVTHETREQAAARLAQIIRDTAAKGGSIVIPSFALERAQDVLYYLNSFMAAHEIPILPVFLDSPMAVNITSVFSRYPELMDSEMRGMLAAGRSPFEFPGLKMIHSAEESRAIAEVEGPAIIIAGSGMATGGRIKHHLVNNISRTESSVVFVGYQAENTLGRQITEGAEDVRIHGSTARAGAHRKAGRIFGSRG
jgi:metallo-beta-lactamase family protein